MLFDRVYDLREHEIPATFVQTKPPDNWPRRMCVQICTDFFFDQFKNTPRMTGKELFPIGLWRKEIWNTFNQKTKQNSVVSIRARVRFPTLILNALTWLWRRAFNKIRTCTFSRVFKTTSRVRFHPIRTDRIRTVLWTSRPRTNRVFSTSAVDTRARETTYRVRTSCDGRGYGGFLCVQVRGGRRVKRADRTWPSDSFPCGPRPPGSLENYVKIKWFDFVAIDEYNFYKISNSI